MNSLILHQFSASPFAEKIRVLLGFKGLSYCSVEIPVIMPKPDLTALTGGYRKTPVLQINNNIYCDTRLISRIIDGYGDGPSIYPSDLTGAASVISEWADSTLFGMSVAMIFSPKGMESIASRMPEKVLKAFISDRMALREGGVASTSLDVAQFHLPVYLQQFEKQLSVNGPFLLGQNITIADFSVYHCLWFIKTNPGISSLLSPYTHINSWMDNMSNYGHGEASIISAEDAIETAKNSEATNYDNVDFEECVGVNQGDDVQVMPIDYGLDPVSGELVSATTDELVVKRTDERAGDVYVHFPRVGFRIDKQK